MSTTPPYLPQTLFGQKGLPGSLPYCDSQGNLIADLTLSADPVNGLSAFNAGVPVDLSGVAFTQTAASAAIASSTTITTLFGTGIGVKAIPANSFAIGDIVRFKLSGIIANTATPNITVTMQGGLASAVTLAVSATAASSTITGTTLFNFEGSVQVRTLGASGTCYATGVFEYFTTGPVVVRVQVLDQAATFDTTIVQTFDVKWTWGTNSASNTITGQTGVIEVLG